MRLLTALGLALLLASPVRADVAKLDIRGFSPDGALFAFEEFGEEPASAVAYATVYVVDTLRNEWATAPLRVRIGAAEGGLAAARERAARLAEPLLRDARIGLPGELLIDDEAMRAEDALRNVAAMLPGLGPAEIRLVERTASNASHCAGGTAKAFDLSIYVVSQRFALQGTGALPRSRGCPTHYGISRVMTLTTPQRRVMVTLVSVYGPGTDGAQRRFIAVTALLP